MYSSEVLKIYRDYEINSTYRIKARRYDNKLGLFYDYLTKLKIVCSVLQAYLKANNVVLEDTSGETLTDIELNNIRKVVKFLLYNESKRQVAANVHT